MVEHDIHDLENARYRAMVSSDITTLDQVLADDLIYTHSSGAVDDKAKYLESIRSGTLRYLSAERQQDSVRVYGDVVIVQGRMKAHIVASGVERQLDNVFTCVWAKKPQGWRMVNWASTPIRKPA